MNKQVIIERICPNCKKQYDIILADADYERWVMGMKVQEVWPDWSAEERERMITGMCSTKCWNEYLGGNDA